MASQGRWPGGSGLCHSHRSRALLVIAAVLEGEAPALAVFPHCCPALQQGMEQSLSFLSPWA